MSVQPDDGELACSGPREIQVRHKGRIGIDPFIEVDVRVAIFEALEPLVQMEGIAVITGRERATALTQHVTRGAVKPMG